MAYMLKLNDWQTRKHIREHGLDKMDRLGRGTFCAVYDETADTVLKLTADAIQYESVRDYLFGTHYPELIGGAGYIGEQSHGELSLYLFRAERLNPLRMADLATKRLARKVLSKVDSVWCSSWNSVPGNHSTDWAYRRSEVSRKTIRELRDDDTLPLSIREAFEYLENFANDYQDVGLDFHRNNLMVRGTDELVFNDVIVSVKPLVASWKI